MATPWQQHLDRLGSHCEDGRVQDFGDAAAELQAAAAGETLLADLSHRALLTATGSEVLSFFQGQLTNDALAAADGHPVLAAHLTPKGRVLASLLLFPLAEGYAVDFAEDMLEPLAKRLRMFVLRADVHIHEAGADWVRFGLTGPDAEAAACAAAGVDRLDPAGTTHGPQATVVTLPGPQAAYAVIAAPTSAEEAWERAAEWARAVGDPAWRLARIRAGVPDLGAATSEQFIPQEVNLEELGGISYTKGCYTGQEVVARTKHLGRRKRRLYRVRTEAVLESGQAVYGEGEQSQGRVVTAAPLPGGGSEALAVLRLESAEGAASLVPEGDAQAPLTRLELPYAFAEDTE
ncbi:MAG TPA: hypothetical protein VJ985_08535 [Gammaproteobacteria bacterium]|nr:hypothetical protein [Gammaproteobacteria bacterium]